VNYVRLRGDAQYYIPFEQMLGDPDYVLVLAAGGGYLTPWNGSDTRIVDRFFLGGENLRGFALGGAGPRDVSTDDSLGGQVMWTTSAEFRFPLPLRASSASSGALRRCRRADRPAGQRDQCGLPQLLSELPAGGCSPRVGARVGVSCAADRLIISSSRGHREEVLR